ncbi:MAG: glycoside hydrolase family 2 TIM barrel-domain containing protein [Terriglobia bacterium]
MDRRKFVKTLGTSAIPSTWILASDEIMGRMNRTSLSEAEKSAPQGVSQASDIWPRPTLVPLPTEVAGASQPITGLDGTWKVTTTPPAEFWANGVDPFGWTDITVPGELTAQGIEFARDNEFAYKRAVTIPSEATGKIVLLRFDGVYSYARVWVNGKYLREHHGGFTSWDCNITEHVTPGQTAWITVGVTDRADDISYASNYAKHYIGGILRSVKLIILPAVHLTRLHAETDFDSAFKDARLRVMASAATGGAQGVKLNLHLTAPDGKDVPLSPNSIVLLHDKTEACVDIPVMLPMKWDAEHPNLYTLGAELIVHKTTVEKLEKKIGFRKVERRRNRLYVNGDAVKLRGVCRHDTHPLGGRVTTLEHVERDAVLLRDANVNFVRTSHYPPTESFLEACDRYGIYVEEESAVCFVQQQWSVTGGGTESDPEFTSRYMNQFTEMIERDRSHPCVIFWSLGNESAWGSNFQKEHDYAKREDTTRPVIFSYPLTVPKGTDCYDLYSEHYPNVDGDLTSKDLPKLNDEYAHISCYNHETLMRAPGVRNFYGHSIKRFWENCYTADGCLGGAIWAGFDEVFLLPGGPVGYGEWGIVDGWRRPKPELWLTKKAYSPVRIPDDDVASVPSPGNPLAIPIKNWFNHTHLGELKILWAVGRDSGDVSGVDLAPGAEGSIIVPGRDWHAGEILNLKFIRAGGIVVDEFNLRIGKHVARLAVQKGPAPRISEDARSLTVQGSEFTVVFDKASGLIVEGTFRGKRIIESGPILNLGSYPLPPWWLTGMSHSTTSHAAVIRTAGAYMDRQGGGDILGVEFEISIDGQGAMTTQYALRGQPKGISEVGIAFTLSSAIDRLTWDRKGLWSAYPSDHIGRPQGTAMKDPTGPAEAYRSEPKGPWSQDSKDFFLYGPNDPGGRGTNDFRSLKENIWQASCILGGTDLRVRAESDGMAAVRAEVLQDGKVRFHIDNLWGYPDLEWGNYAPPVTVERGYKNSVRLRLTDTDAE